MKTPIPHPESRLTVISQEPSKNWHRMWLCRCNCGNTLVLPSSKITSGHSKSCGCYKNDLVRNRSITHGQSKTPLYEVYSKMLYRARNARDKRYAGRGITVCDRWQGKVGFQNFLADMGERPTPDHQIERKDNDAPYSPENCKWATRSENCNNRRDNHHFEYNGETHTIPEWSQITGIPYFTLRSRLVIHKWSIERALTRPVGPKDKKS